MTLRRTKIVPIFGATLYVLGPELY